MKRRILSLTLAICMIASLLPATGITAKAVDPVSHMTVTLTGNSKRDVDVSATTPIKTIVMENGVATVKTGVVDGWIVKMDYNAGGTPIMTLKNASATEIAARPANEAALNIALEGVNTLTSATALSAGGQDILFSGTGSLLINGNDGIGNGTETVTVQSGTVTVDTKYQAVKVKALVVEGGTLSSKTVWGNTTNGKAIIAESIVIKGGTVEAESSVGALSVAPDLSGYSNYAAVGGESSDNATAYAASNALLYKYIKVESSIRISHMTVTLSGSGKKDINVSEATPVRTVVMEDGMATVKTGVVDGWVVKMDYNAGGIPTMTLRNASVTEITARPENNLPLNIALEGTSSLTSAVAISANGKDLTFSGTGTLNITNTGTGIGTAVETVTVDGPTVNVSTGWYGIEAASLVVEDGTLSVTTTRADKHAIYAMGNILIKGGVVEAYSAKGALSVAPDLSRCYVSSAVGGVDSATATEYAAAQATGYKYIRIEAETLVSHMTVTLSGSGKRDVDVSEAVPVKTVVMENGTAAVKTGEASGWIVKMDYNAGGIPTMTLKNASVTEISARPANNASLHIALEGTNTLTSATAISANGKDLTFSGSGVLNISNTGTGIGTGNETITVDGATVNVSTGWYGIEAKNLVVEDGSLTVTTTRADKYAIYATGSITVNGGNVEAYSAKGAVNIAPDLSGYSEYIAVGGINSSSTAEYAAADATYYKYIKIEKANPISHMTVTLSGSGKRDVDVSVTTPIKTIVMENGAATVKIGEAEGWIVKMDYNAGGTPIMTLKNAAVTEISARPANEAALHIVLEGVNTVTTTNNPLNARGYDITFSGTGTLNVTPTAGTGIGTGSETVTVDGATVNVSTVWFGMEVKNLVVESGSLSVTTSRDDKVAINASDSITVKGGTLEVYSAKGALSVAPDLSQYSSYTAVGGVSSIFTSTYDPTSAVLYKYIKIEPLGSGTGSDDDNDGVKPFYALAWDYIDESLTPNVNECVFLSVTVTDGNVGFRMDGVGTDMDAIVANVKMEMAARPQGMRYLCIPGIDQALSMAPEAIIYLDTGVNKLKEQFTLFLQKYYALGGQLDGVVIDLEYLPMGSWYIYAQGYGGAGNNQNIYNDIVNHPKYQTEVRPMLEARNFTFYTQVGGEKSEIWSICYKTGNAYEVDRCIWDVVMRSRLSQYMNEALFAPLTTYYPNAILSDYQSTDTYGWLKDLHDDGGRPVYQGGNYMKTGNTSNFNFYGSRPGNNYYVSESTGLPVYNTPPSYTGAVYKRDAYNMLLWDMMKAKHIVEATDDGFVNFWVGTHDVYYGGYTSGTYANTPYYSELVLHFGLMNPQPFLLYLSKGEYKVDGAVDVDKYNAAVMVMSELLEELTRLVGAEDRTPIAFPVSWNDGYLLSGMSAGGKNIWRITPDTALTTLEGFQVADAVVPTFSVNGRTVSFPQGRIIETAPISQVGTCGYWVETPAGVVPVVKSDADRFEAYPAYGEDYEGFEANTQYTSETALPAATWTVTGTAAVQASGDNQALAVTGDFSLVNTQLPQNITAGDSYAAHQAWQVSVTLPENLDAAAVLNLLTANGDSGVKLTNGKAYYTASGVDTELATLSAGTYVIKRALDFSNNTCDYYVYSAAGTLLGSATDIALPEITLPVTAIAMTGTGLGTAAVLLDDYKLYITGFEGDFELYDADAGVRVVNETAARAADTAYRYSWANASDKVKNATVVASYYDEDNNLLSQQVVKTLRMVPGNDGVETGIVPLGEQAAAVLVSLVFGADTDPTADDFVYTPTADDYNSANDNT